MNPAEARIEGGNGSVARHSPANAQRRQIKTVDLLQDVGDQGVYFFSLARAAVDPK